MLVSPIVAIPSPTLSSSIDRKPEIASSDLEHQKDTVSLSADAAKAPVSQSSGANKSADDVSFAVGALTSSVDMANSLRGEYKKENTDSVIKLLGEDGAKKYFDDLKKTISQLDQSVSSWSGYISEK